MLNCKLREKTQKKFLKNREEIDKKNERNLWLSRIVAFAYRYQQEARPYKELIRDFATFLRLTGGEKVLDIGCGSGRLIKLVLKEMKNPAREVIGLDNSLSAINYARKNIKSSKVSFVCSDISNGLPFLPQSGFDLIMAGLSIQYAQHWNGQQWTDQAYIRVIKDIFQVLKPGGWFVFSVNVPNPDFSKVAKKSWQEIFFSRRLFLNLIVAAIMLWQAKWLVKKAAEGRFHYLPIERVTTILQNVGFTNISYKLSYAELAWVIACQKLASNIGDKILSQKKEL